MNKQRRQQHRRTARTLGISALLGYLCLALLLMSLTGTQTQSKYVLNRYDTLVLETGRWPTSAAISGIPEIRQVLTASHEASDIPVSYQWLFGSSADGPFAAMGLGMNTTYTTKDSDLGKYFQVQAIYATPNGRQVTVISAPFGPIGKIQLRAQSIVRVGSFLYPNLTQTELNHDTNAYDHVDFQWVYTTASIGNPVTYDWSNAAGWTQTRMASYNSWSNFRVQITAKPNSLYTGTVYMYWLRDNQVYPGTAGAPVAGSVLSAQVTPTGLPYTIQWYRGAASGVGTAINGATANTLTIQQSYGGAYIWYQIVANGQTHTSARVGPVMALSIQGTPVIGLSLSLQSHQPASFTSGPSYQWQRGGSETDPFTDIAGATNPAGYTLVAADEGKFFRLAMTGITTNAATGASNGSLTAYSNVLGQRPRP